LPGGVPDFAIVDGRQLPLGPGGVALPEQAEQVADGRGQVEGAEALHVTLVRSEELTAGRQVVVGHVAVLGVDPGDEPGTPAGGRAGLHVREGAATAATEMQEDAEGVDADAVGDGRVPGTVDIPGPDDDIWKTVSASIGDDQFVLLDL